MPTGLAAYDFGFGTVFFDYENDGDQDLYWLGAMSDPRRGPERTPLPWRGTHAKRKRCWRFPRHHC